MVELPSLLAQPSAALLRSVLSPRTTDQRAELLLSFGQLTIPGEGTFSLKGHLSGVSNARETLPADGTIVGVLESDTPASLLSGALKKLGQIDSSVNDQIQKQKIGQVNTAVELPVGTDIQFTLTEPLRLKRVVASAGPGQLPADLRASVADGSCGRTQTRRKQRSTAGRSHQPGVRGHRASKLSRRSARPVGPNRRRKTTNRFGKPPRRLLTTMGTTPLPFPTSTCSDGRRIWRSRRRSTPSTSATICGYGRRRRARPTAAPSGWARPTRHPQQGQHPTDYQHDDQEQGKEERDHAGPVSRGRWGGRC